MPKGMTNRNAPTSAPLPTSNRERSRLSGILAMIPVSTPMIKKVETALIMVTMGRYWTP